MNISLIGIVQAVIIGLLLWVGSTILRVDKENAIQSEQIQQIKKLIDSRTVWYDSANGRIIILEKNVEDIQEQIKKLYPVENMYYRLGNKHE